MYHLSFENLDGKILQPRIPDNYLTAVGYEENTIQRVCFSETISGALMSMHRCLTDKILYVHKPLRTSKTITNEEIINKQYVPDAVYSKEIWVLEEVELEVIKKIRVIGTIGEFNYQYGEHTAPIYQWGWLAIK